MIHKKPIMQQFLNDRNRHELIVLRRFRDDVLATSRVGRSAIRFYCHHGPAWANWISRSRFAGCSVRTLLILIARFLEG